MKSFGSILPWKDKLNQDYNIETISTVDTEDAACLQVGKFIRAWFSNHPGEQELTLRRDAAGVPQIKTCNMKSLRRTLIKTTFEDAWRFGINAK